MIFVHFSIKLWVFKIKIFHRTMTTFKHISDGEYMCDKISCLRSYFNNFSTLLQNFINKNIFKKFFLNTFPIYFVLTMHFKPLKIFQLPNSIYINIRRWLQQKIGFFAFQVHFGPLKLRYSQLLFYTFLHIIVGS